MTKGSRVCMTWYACFMSGKLSRKWNKTRWEAFERSLDTSITCVYVLVGQVCQLSVEWICLCSIFIQLRLLVQKESLRGQILLERVCNQRIQYTTKLQRFEYAKFWKEESMKRAKHMQKIRKKYWRVDHYELSTITYYHITVTWSDSDKSRAWKVVWISRCSTSLGRSVDFRLQWDSKSADLVAYRIHPWISRSHAFHHGSEIVHVGHALPSLAQSGCDLREHHKPFSTSNPWRHCSAWHVAVANSDCSQYHSPHATDHILRWSNLQNSRPKDIGHDPTRSWPEAFSHIDSHDLVPSNGPLEVSLSLLSLLQFSHTPLQSHGLDFVGTGPFVRRKIRSKQTWTDKYDKYSQVGNFRRPCVVLDSTVCRSFFTLWTTPLSSNI